MPLDYIKTKLMDILHEFYSEYSFNSVHLIATSGAGYEGGWHLDSITSSIIWCSLNNANNILQLLQDLLCTEIIDFAL